MKRKALYTLLMAAWACMVYRTITGGAMVFGVSLADSQLVYSNLLTAYVYEVTISVTYIALGCVTGLVLASTDKFWVKNTKQGIKYITKKYDTFNTWLGK